MRVIKLMADYQCWPLWEESPGCVGNINPDELPISQGLKQQLAEWARAYDATLNMDDPLSSGFESPSDEHEFKSNGYKLAEQLRQELGHDFSVSVKV